MNHFFIGYIKHEYHECEISLAKDYRVNLSQVCLSAKKINKLYKVLNDWLNLPITELAKQPLNFSINLIEFEGQKLTISFKRLPHTSQIITEHLFKLTYATSSLSGKVEFMVDHTCIQILIDGLKEFIETG